MGEVILKNAIEREPGYLYYVDADGSVCRAEMQHKGRPKKEK